MDEPRSIAIRKWAAGQGLELAWQQGTGDEQLTGWLRADSYRAIETNADPIWEDDDAMRDLWP